MNHILKAKLLTGALAVSLGAQAAVVNEGQALSLANSFFSASSRAPRTTLRLVSDSRALPGASRAGDPAYFIFAPQQGPGFVIVAGDDSLDPVLGYSFDATFSSKLPPQLAAALADVQTTVEQLRAEGASSATHEARWKASRAGTPVVSYETAQWNQGSPYNGECPGLTGCVNTALAIVMRYHQWPPAADGVTEAYSNNGIPVPSRDLSSHTYDWKSLPLTDAAASSSGWTADQKRQIAQIMADIGHANKSTYGYTATSSWYQGDVLYRHFRYSPDMKIVYRENGLTQSQWYDKVRAELDKAPLPYDGRQSSEGHSYVLDGYTDDNYFHINWGWGGYCNGYFQADRFIGGGQNYSGSPKMIVDMKPRTGDNDTPKEWFSIKSIVYTPDVKQIYVTISNWSVMTFTGHLKIAITDKNGTVKEWIDYDPEVNVLPDYWFGFPVYLSASTEVRNGDRAVVYYRATGKSEWTEIADNDELGYLLDKYSIPESTSVSYDRKNKTLTVDTKDGMTFSLTDDSGNAVTAKTLTDKKAVYSTAGFSAGKYTLTLTKGSETHSLTLNMQAAGN